jgi:large subunit ribosomal protein L25
MSDIKLEEDVVSQISDRDFTIATIAAPTVMPVEEEPKTEGEEGEEGAEGEEEAEDTETKEGEEGKEGKSEETKKTEFRKEEDSKK